MRRVLMTAAASLALVALWVSGPARANVVTFDGGTLTHPGDGRSGVYIEDGLEVDFYGDAPDFVSDGAGGHAIEIHLNNIITMHPTAGGPFSLDGFHFFGGGDTAFRGYEGNTNTISIGLSGLAADVHPSADSALWSHITSVSWCGFCISGFDPNNAIDTVRFNLPPPPPTSGVPEPAGWALMILGFGGLGAALRGRRDAAARA